MTSVGIDQNTGKVLVGWAHVAQSIVKIVSTELGSRVERRDFGSRLPNLIDQPQNEESLLDFFHSLAEALEPRVVRNSIYGEPRFDLIAVGLDVKTPGVLAVTLAGDYYQDGHRTTPLRKQLVIEVPATPLN